MRSMDWLSYSSASWTRSVCSEAERRGCLPMQFECEIAESLDLTICAQKLLGKAIWVWFCGEFGEMEFGGIPIIGGSMGWNYSYNVVTTRMGSNCERRWYILSLDFWDLNGFHFHNDGPSSGVQGCVVCSGEVLCALSMSSDCVSCRRLWPKRCEALNTPQMCLEKSM